ncbi:MAG: glycerol-3-phosphate 1-O-acyltransferase [Rhodococcus sp.]|nr:glycerol-3-phosphate 1-O-acyltransferase [Rhodococcus sp. (in: high G+C Gram-positive bacteria)]
MNVAAEEGASGRVRVYLTESMSPTEAEVMNSWLGDRRSGNGSGPRVVEAADEEALAKLVRDGGDPLLTPVRVIWMPDKEDGNHRLRDALSNRDPLHPPANAQRRLLRVEPDRCRVLEGEAAPLSDLANRFAERGGGSLPRFIRRQAALALERAERSLLGTQYKVARFVVDDIAETNRFRDGILELAQRLKAAPDQVASDAREALNEMVAAQSRRAIAVWDQLGHYFSRAYRLDVNTQGFAELRRLNEHHSLVFLPSHRSYLDPLVLRPALVANGLPLNHVMGGLNVGFWPIGPISKRSGTVFIRRKIEGDEIYKWALSEYMRYLIGKRFNLEWYIEGGRSRTGKLRPPRYGLLNYLSRALQNSEGADVYLVPVSITYDQLYEVSAMAAEAHGAAKSKEGLRWLLGYVRAQGERHGVAHVSIGRPLSLAEHLSQETDQRLAVQKTAFEVCHRINEVTPVTASSLVMLAFLGIEDRALTVGELQAILGPMVKYITDRELPTAGDVDLTNPQVIRTAVQTHLDSGVLRSFGSGEGRVYYLGRNQHLVAAFYRNNTIHFLVVRAITEMGLLAAAEEGFTDRLADSWAEALRLRDLLKFEFFFGDKEEFRAQARAELSLIVPDWEARIDEENIARTALASVSPYLAHRVLQPFLESYLVVAEQLSRCPVEGEFDEPRFMADCLELAEEYRLRQQIASTESISNELFATALKLARNRGAVEDRGDGVDVAAQRQAFVQEIRTTVDRVRRIRALANERLDRLEDVR